MPAGSIGDSLAATPSVSSGFTNSRGEVLYAVTPYGRNGPSSRVRVFEWLDRLGEPFALSSYVSHRNAQPAYLASHPRSVLAAELRLRRMASKRPRRLLLHKEASPLSRGGLERALLRRAEFAVYDFDDALQWDYGAGGLLRRVAPKAPKALAAAQTADRVVAGNDVLATWAADHNRDVVIIPSCVDPAAYRRKQAYEVGSPPRLGWIGSAGNEEYLLLIAPALREVHELTGARLTLVGTTQRTLGDLEAIIDRVPWSEENQHAGLADIDLGLAPLPDRPRARQVRIQAAAIRRCRVPCGRQPGRREFPDSVTAPAAGPRGIRRLDGGDPRPAHPHDRGSSASRQPRA